MEQISKAIDIRRAGRELYGRVFALFHSFHGAAGMEVAVPVPEGLEITDIYSCETEHVWLDENKLNINLIKDLQAVAILLEVKK